jgi:hypothetical protein
LFYFWEAKDAEAKSGAGSTDLTVIEAVSRSESSCREAWRTSDGYPGLSLSLYHRTTPTTCFRAFYEPGLSIFVQGRKRILLGGTEYLCDGSSFLLSSIDVPAQSQIIEASEKTPLLSFFLRLDMPTVREVLSRDDIPEGPPSNHRQGLVVGETTVGLLGAAMRMLELLDTPEEIPFLGPLARREILYRILRTPQAERLRAIATSGDLGQRTARAISWLRENYAKPLRMEELASGCFNPASSVPRSHNDEPAAVRKAVATTNRASADAHGRTRCYDRRV